MRSERNAFFSVVLVPNFLLSSGQLVNPVRIREVETAGHSRGLASRLAQQVGKGRVSRRQQISVHATGIEQSGTNFRIGLDV